MKRRSFFLTLFLSLALSLSLSIIGCSSSGSGGNSAEEKGPETKIKNGIDVDEIDLISFDENGITLAFTHNHGNIIVLPKSFKIAGKTYSLLGSDEELNPEVHFRVDDSDKDSFSLEIKEGETHQAHIAIDGVTDYSNFKMTVDNTIYYDDGKSYPIKDVSFEVITE